MLAVEDAYTAASRDVGLTAQQAQLLCLTRRAAPIGALADALRCDRSNVSRMVDRAGERGLVTRRPDPADGRVAIVMLTDAGERAMRRFIETLDARIGDLVADWPAQRRKMALDILNDLAAALEGERPRPAATRPPTAAARGIEPLEGNDRSFERPGPLQRA